ncbi:hypothetical protein FNV58_01060 (plasmid) [Streptomyces sp. RLB1-9]|nr:hypothetical protein FNV58_01060 [Streptomyces sp. RLB1-9]
MIDEKRIPPIEARIADLMTDVEFLQDDAARLRTVAADYRAQHTAATAAPVTLTTPYAFIDWYADYGTDKITDADADATLTAARTAYRTTAPRENVKITTADPRILDGLTTAAAGFIASTREDIDNNPDMAGLLARDIRRTERFMERITEVRTLLLDSAQEAQEAQQTAQEAPAAPAAPQEAPTAAEGPVRADWERDLPATPATAAPAAPFDTTDPATWAETPEGYEWREVDAETGELQLFAPDGTNLSAALPAPTATNTEAQMIAARPRVTTPAPAAPQGLADWERDLLAAAPTLPTADREPSADQNIAEGDDPQGPQERPTVGESSDPYPTHNTMGRCTHGHTCRFHRPTAACGIWIHPDRTTCTATPTVHVTWTDTVRGHHHATVTLPGGGRARITYAPHGTVWTYLGAASMGTGSPTVARARSLADLITQYARLKGYTAARIEEYGTPERPAR